MPDSIIVNDFNSAINKVGEVKKFLHDLYMDPTFSTIFNRPVLSMLDSACIYLIDNLRSLLSKYLTKKG